MTERLLTARELAELLGFAAGTVVDWAERGELPGFKVGGRLRSRASEVETWLEVRRMNGPGAAGAVSPAPTAYPTRGVVYEASPAPHRGGESDAC